MPHIYNAQEMRQRLLQKTPAPRAELNLHHEFITWHDAHVPHEKKKEPSRKNGTHEKTTSTDQRPRPRLRLCLSICLRPPRTAAALLRSSAMQSRSALKLLMLALLSSAGALPGKASGKASGKGAGGPGATKSPAASAVSRAPIAPFALPHTSPRAVRAISARQAALRHDEVVLRGWAARRYSAVQGAPPARSP